MNARPVLVTGGTGTLGRLVVSRLRNEGQTVRVLSRHTRPAEEAIEYVAADLSTGEGTERGVEGADIIVHCAGTSSGDDVKTRHLVRAAAGAGARHVVFI